MLQCLFLSVCVCVLFELVLSPSIMCLRSRVPTLASVCFWVHSCVYVISRCDSVLLCIRVISCGHNVCVTVLRLL